MTLHGDVAAEPIVDPATFRALSADLYINTRCNFGCRTCFLGDAYFERDLTMSVDEVAAIGAWLVEAGVRDVAVLGGEPTLHPHLPEILSALRNEGVAQLRLITNGTPRARRLLAGPLEGLVDLTYVSLDGATAEVNDALRGPGTFRHAMLAIDLLRERGLPFVITATLGRAAVEQLDDLLELAEASGCRTLNVHWLSSVGRARGQDMAVPAERWREVVTSVDAYKPRRSDLEVECQVGSRPPGAPWAPRIDPSACAVRDRANLQFMPDGHVFSCGLLVDSPGLAGYRWDGEHLLRRAGVTEVTVSDAFDGPGCPARLRLLGEAAAEHPVCIYERVVRSSDN
jgi:MoaA/NifB/PqqE/SkfB family radical SAM enzyme